MDSAYLIQNHANVSLIVIGREVSNMGLTITILLYIMLFIFVMLVGFLITLKERFYSEDRR